MDRKNESYDMTGVIFLNRRKGDKSYSGNVTAGGKKYFLKGYEYTSGSMKYIRLKLYDWKEEEKEKKDE